MSNRYFFLARAAARHVANMSRDSRELRTTNGWDLFSSFASPFSSIRRAAPHLVLVQAILRKVDAAGAEFCFFCAHAAAHHVANISPLSGDLCKQIFRAFFLRHGFACSYRELHRRAWIEERDACP